MKSIKITLSGMVILLSSMTSFGQQDRPLHEVYSMMVFNFIKFIQWPPDETRKEFVIGVMGNSKIYSTLSAWYGGKPKGNMMYVIKKFTDASEVTDCQVLFIEGNKSNEFEVTKSKLLGKGTLLITDHHGLGAKGSCINFKLEDKKLRFELNQRAIDESKLKVASVLSTMAIMI
jgi:hypothetical protein